MKDDDEDDEDFEIDPCSMFPDEPRSSVMCDDILPNFDDMFSTIDGMISVVYHPSFSFWIRVSVSVSICLNAFAQFSRYGAETLQVG